MTQAHSDDEVTTLTDLEARTETGTWTGTQRHSDADSMRREFGFPAFDESAFDWPSVAPGCLMHARDNSAHSPAGGTDFMATGKPGCGKSTLALYWSIRLLEVNNEAVVWRGSESRSEWVPLAPWATVCLPASCDVEVTLKKTTGDGSTRTVDLEDVVREVQYYEDPRDLWENHVDGGKFHVVYPDPEMRGCQELYEESNKTYDLEFSREDPVKHWWVAAVLARVEYGPYHTFVSLMFDEIGDLIPQEASKDRFATFQKILLFRDLYVDARKFFLSLFTFGHSRTDVHEKVRRKVRWHITMNGIANPTRASQVVGVENVPMRTDLTSRMDVGKCLMWTETNFEPRLAWKDIPAPTDEVLVLDLQPTAPKDPADARDAGGGTVAATDGGTEARESSLDEQQRTLDRDATGGGDSS
ncbi:ATP-binding protein [Halolamina sp.]|uniref:ATP-binding protein n=1 Tax=Halolamina sp. TaxID=1940283 RepID=UPI003564E9E9